MTLCGRIWNAFRFSFRPLQQSAPAMTGLNRSLITRLWLSWALTVRNYNLSIIPHWSGKNSPPSYLHKILVPVHSEPRKAISHCLINGCIPLWKFSYLVAGNIIAMFHFCRAPTWHVVDIRHIIQFIQRYMLYSNLSRLYQTQATFWKMTKMLNHKIKVRLLWRKIYGWFEKHF